MRTYQGLPWALCLHLGAALLIIGCAAVAAAQQYQSPLAVVGNQEGSLLYVAEHTAHTVAVVDLSRRDVLRRFPLSKPPAGLALSADEKTLFVCGASPEGCVYGVDVDSGAIEWEKAVGHTPIALAVQPDKNLLFVACQFNNNIAVVDLNTHSLVKHIPVEREPVALALAAAGTKLYVANLLPTGPSDGDYIAAAISVIDTESLEGQGEIALPNGCTSLRGLCASPDGRYVYVTHILGRYHLPTTQLERGWMNTNALSIVDTADNSFVNTILLDDVDQGAANPWAPACSPDGKLLCITHAGTHELSVIDRAALHERLDALDEKEAKAVPNNLAFNVGLRSRIALPGNGPRGLWVNNDTAFAALYFDDSVAEISLTSQGRNKTDRIPLVNEDVVLSEERKGEQYFHDAELCFQHWQSCISCHPEARVDGLNWDLMNDGIGNPKNTRSMLLSHATPPVMSLGVRDKAETAVRAGIRYIQFAIRPDEDAQAIDSYLKALKPVASPYLQEGALTESAQRGKELFHNQAGCAHCHPAPLYTDLKLHELGLTQGLDEGKAVDTPTLVEIWRTAPYLHDGRAATLHEVLKQYNADDRHGKTKDLDEEALDDLVAFLLSL